MKDSSKWKTFNFLTENPIVPIAEVQVQRPFAFDLAFAMTIHKAQGRTISRVVLDLTCHPQRICRMKHAAVFVAMSRVCKRDHMRLLEPGGVRDMRERRTLYEYLEELRPDPYIGPFFHGFNGNNSTWCPERALNYEEQ